MAKQDKKKTTQQPIRQENTFSFLQDWHCLSLLALFVVIFFHQVIFGTSFFWEDFLFYFYPVRNFATVSLSNGEIPLWNPFTFGGTPFQADIQTTVFYLPNWLLIPFVSDGTLNAWYNEMLIIAHFFLAGVTMFYCAKSFGLARIPAAFSALAYMLSGFAIVHTIHQVVIAQVAWFPLIVFLFKRTFEERSLLWMVLCGFILSLAVLGGHPQFTLYFFFFLFIFFLFEIYNTIRDAQFNAQPFPANIIFQTSVLAAGVILISIGLSAIQLLPTFELANLSVREEITYAKSSEGQLSWQQLFTLLIPKFFGTANHLLADNPLRYWGPQSYWNFWETCIYVGVGVLALALLSFSLFKRQRYVAFFICYATFALLYALGDNFFVHKIFYEVMPGFDKFRSMGRWGFFFTFSFALLSGFGLQQILSRNKEITIFPKIIFSLAGILLLVIISIKTNLLDGFIGWQARTGGLKNLSPQESFSLAFLVAQSQAIGSLIIALLCCAVLFLLWKKNTSRFFIALLFVLQFIDFAVFGFLQNNGKTSPKQYFTQRERLVSFLKEEGKKNYFRVNARNRGTVIIDRNQGMLDQIFLMEGYTPLALQRVLPPVANPDDGYRLLNTRFRVKIDTVMVGTQGRPQMRFVNDSIFFPRAFFVYKSRVFSSEHDESLFVASKNFSPREHVVLTESPNVTIEDSSQQGDWNATIESYSNNSFTVKVETPKKGFLVLSEIFYPGWNAYVDGKQTKVYRADWSLRALVVEKGEHTIEMKFEPEPFYSGMKISLATLLLCVAIGGFDYYRKRTSIGKQNSNPKSHNEQ
ncbi:MAG: YfhO family protein [Ignavibacteria bacterium]|nr:YfhO family protein [Ignavibacteria bacterium]